MPTALPTHNPACAWHPLECLKVEAVCCPEVVQVSEDKSRQKLRYSNKKNRGRNLCAILG
jgi:hypothetical protein